MINRIIKLKLTVRLKHNIRSTITKRNKSCNLSFTQKKFFVAIQKYKILTDDKKQHQEIINNVLANWQQFGWQKNDFKISRDY